MLTAIKLLEREHLNHSRMQIAKLCILCVDHSIDRSSMQSDPGSLSCSQVRAWRPLPTHRCFTPIGCVLKKGGYDARTNARAFSKQNEVTTWPSFTLTAVHSIIGFWGQESSLFMLKRDT